MATQTTFQHHKGLLDLASELILSIANFADSEHDISRLSRTSKRLQAVLSNYLLQHNIKFEESSALIWAAKKNRHNLARNLLQFGADINTIVRMESPLYAASAAGNIEMVKIFLDAGADVEKRTPYYNEAKPLTVAMEEEHLAVCHLLITRSTEINGPARSTISQPSDTALHVAALGCLSTVVRHLLERGAEVNPEGIGHRQLFPLQCALGKNSQAHPDRILQCVLLLLEYGADIDVTGGILGHFWPSSRSLGQEHADPRIRALFSRRQLPLVSRGDVQDNFLPWMSPITREEEELLLRPGLGDTIFDLSQFQVDHERLTVVLEAPFPPLEKLERGMEGKQTNIEESLGEMRL